AVTAVRARDGVFVAVTARPLRDAVGIARRLGVDGLVCSGGAVVADPLTGRVLESTLLRPGVVDRIVAVLRAGVPGARVGVDYLDRCDLDAGFTLTWSGAADTVHPGPAPAATGPAVKVIVQTERGDAAEAARTVLAGSGLPVTVGVPCSEFAEVLPHGVDKAAHVARLAAAMPRPPATVAFGDMPSDLPMLRWADTAVAVANAHPAVLSAADEVTGANHEDGVAAYLERLLATSAA
ncbi:MAG TPA: HAD family hydrolase, partial [Pseudonocardia sp.]|nr:HAD family hydrolase [Pseudonocardia sp.]